MAVVTARRRLVATLSAAMLAPPVMAWAQGLKPVSGVGVLSPNAEPSETESAFQRELGVFGYVVGRNLFLDYRGAAERTDRLDQLAIELVSAEVDVIFASGSQATRAVRAQTKTIPIVTLSTNPVGLGFVASLARPGGNIPGISILGPEVTGKRFELLKELVPATVKVAVFWNPNDPGAQFSLAETQAVAETLKIELQILETRGADDFDAAFQVATRESATAVFLLPAPIIYTSRSRIAELRNIRTHSRGERRL